MDRNVATAPDPIVAEAGKARFAIASTSTRQPRKRSDVLVARTGDVVPPILRVPCICCGCRGKATTLRRQRRTSWPVSVETNSWVARFQRCRTMATVRMPFAYVAPFERKYQEYCVLGKLGYQGRGPGRITSSSAAKPAPISSSAAEPASAGLIRPKPGCPTDTGGTGRGCGTAAVAAGKVGKTGRCV